MLPELEQAQRLVVSASIGSEDLSAADLCVLWLDLIEFQKVLDAVMYSVEAEATEKLHAHFGDDEHGRAITGRRTMFDTPAGPVHLEMTPVKRRASGKRILDQLVAPMITNDGELVDAVPAAVLAEVLPAVAAQGETSGGWRWAPLRRVLGDDMYDRIVAETPIEERLPVLRPGEVWRR